MGRQPSPTYSPELDWWLRDGGAALGESSTLGPSLERMELYGRRPWKPERRPRRPEDRDRDLTRILPGEADSIDPDDYFVEGHALRRRPRTTVRACGTPPDYSVFGAHKACPTCRGVACLQCDECHSSGIVANRSAQPTGPMRSAPEIPEPNIRGAQRARRIARAWSNLTPAQRRDLWLAYRVGIDWGTETQHRAFRRAALEDAEMLVKSMAGYFRGTRHAA